MATFAQGASRLPAGLIVRDFTETEASVSIIFPLTETESSEVGIIQPIHVLGLDQFHPTAVEEILTAWTSSEKKIAKTAEIPSLNNIEEEEKKFIY